MGDLDSLSAPQLLLCTVLALVSHSLSSLEISLTEVMKITPLFFTRFYPNLPGRQNKSTQKDMTSTLICVILVFLSLVDYYFSFTVLQDESTGTVRQKALF